jgi:hypothetical protein
VFGSGNQAAHLKHLATHDDEVQRACDCPACLGETGARGKKRKAEKDEKTDKKKRKSGSEGVLKAITKSFNETTDSEENNVDNPEEVTEEDEGIAEVHGEFDDEEESMNVEPRQFSVSGQRSTDNGKQFSVNCGVCGNSFKDIDKLEEHIGNEHTKDPPKLLPFVAREGGWECHLCHRVLRTSRELKNHKARRECKVLQEVGGSSAVPPAPPATTASTAATSSATWPHGAVRNNVNALWQQSESRNWAAEFGYGRAGEAEGRESVKAGDILTAMKMKFGVAGEEEEEDREAGDERYLYGSKREARQEPPVGEPRVLSAASRQTRSCSHWP